MSKADAGPPPKVCQNHDERPSRQWRPSIGPATARTAAESCQSAPLVLSYASALSTLAQMRLMPQPITVPRDTCQGHVIHNWAGSQAAPQPRLSVTSMVARPAQGNPPASPRQSSVPRISLAGGIAHLPSGDGLKPPRSSPGRPSTAPVAARQARASAALRTAPQEESEDDDLLTQARPRRSQAAVQPEALRKSVAARQTRASMAQPAAAPLAQDDSDEDVHASRPPQPRPSSAVAASLQPSKPQARQSCAVAQPQDDSEEDMLSGRRVHLRQRSATLSQPGAPSARQTRASVAQPGASQPQDESDDDIMSSRRLQPRPSSATLSQPGASQARATRASMVQPAAPLQDDSDEDITSGRRQQPRQSSAAASQPGSTQARQTRASLVQAAGAQPQARQTRASVAQPSAAAAQHSEADEDDDLAVWGKAAGRPSVKAASPARPSQAHARPSIKPAPRQSAADLAPMPAGAGTLALDVCCLWP